ncbi:MAG: haloacid dehalogenase-like hydrolase [Candidatus Brocadiae bacterium]|nr:haloacid dehalogenase-like hydrolase [Candidatus Brocadiia bacterium]
MILILWDIDGTLLSSHGAGTRAMNLAFEECWGIADAFDDVVMAGCTDPWIFRQGYEQHRLAEPFPEALGRFDGAYRRLLPGVLAGSRVTLKPGLPGALERLATRADVAQGLLTGNFEHGAWTKVRAAGIDRYFATGAFGSDDEDRNALVPHALRRHRERGLDVTPERTVVIGDTPKDIACARAWGARAVAVATGGHRLADLEQHAPDLALSTLGAGDALDGFLGRLPAR